MITFSAPLWVWNAEKGSWHFITVPEEQSLEIRAEGFASRGGFGSVRVEVTVSGVKWRTSVFPQKDGTYLLPVKAEVRGGANLTVGEDVNVQLELIQGT